MQDGDFATAARLAFALRHPGRLLAVIQRTSTLAALSASMRGGSSAAQAQAQARALGAQQMLAGLVAHMGPEDLKTALEYCRCARVPPM